MFYDFWCKSVYVFKTRGWCVSDEYTNTHPVPSDRPSLSPDAPISPHKYENTFSPISPAASDAAVQNMKQPQTVTSQLFLRGERWRWATSTEASERAVWPPFGPPVTSEQLHTFHWAPGWPYMEQWDEITVRESCIHLLFLEDMSDGG